MPAILIAMGERWVVLNRFFLAILLSLQGTGRKGFWLDAFNHFFMESIIMANDAVHPLLARADAVILETRRLQAEMDRTVTIVELNAQRLERTYLDVRSMISNRSTAQTTSRT